ncbi:hypothetical protein [Allobranchiibius sp. CTAmp26]|uniref:hypothetical protein n=1 Tax=Allobranchiibius sp. CTAmp26 TaxID=2815214 RepID=UPI001AA0E120|nr:hypothetical protein [Allobranchiibius sp. CTAmp26]
MGSMVAPAGRVLHPRLRQPVSRRDGDRARLVGYSLLAGFVITVILTPTDHAGVTAWKACGADLRAYEEQERP